MGHIPRTGHILVVDDEAAIRTLVAEILEADGHHVTQAPDGEEALAVIDTTMPDLIVLDLAMPGVDGWHFLDELHRRSLREATRVLIMSGRYEPAAVLADHRATPGCFLLKPFEPEVLSQMVADVLAMDASELYQRRARPATLARLVSKVDQALHDH